jgi:hypothetical protein
MFGYRNEQTTAEEVSAQAVTTNVPKCYDSIIKFGQASQKSFWLELVMSSAIENNHCCSTLAWVVHIIASVDMCD